MIGRVILRRRAQSAGLAAVLLAILTTFFGSIAVLRVERVAGGNILTAGDALWWSVATMTTAGFGDLYPTTAEGRIIATGLMLVGIGVFGTVTALIATWVLSGPETEAAHADLE